MSQSNLRSDQLSISTRSEENIFDYDSNASKKCKLELEEMETITGKVMFCFGREDSDYQKLIDPFYFTIHSTMDIIIFCNTYDSLIQLYTLGGDYITAITEPTLPRPLAVFVTENFLYATGDDFLATSLFQFSDLTITRRHFYGLNTLWNPKGLACDSQENAYFIDEFGQKIIVFDTDMDNYREIDIEQHKDCIDLFIENNNLVLLSQSPPHIVYLTLEGDFLWEFNCIEFISFPHSFCSDRDGRIILSDVQNNVLKVFTFRRDSSYKLYFLYLDFDIPNYTNFQRIALTHNSTLIMSSLEMCISVALS